MVKPPAKPAFVPLSQSSLCVAPGSRKWTCGSINPGSFIILCTQSSYGNINIFQLNKKIEPVGSKKNDTPPMRVYFYLEYSF
jgi:hypothetical protein